MAEIRCPMCGRPNPSEEEVCRFCQARLKPLVVSPFSGEGAPIKPGETPTPKNTSDDLEPSLPDWLRDLRQDDETEPEPESEEDLPDWFAQEPGEVSEPGEPGDRDTSDWLRDLRKKDEQEESEPPASIPDWLSTVPESSEEESTGDTSDWWSRVSKESEPQEEPVSDSPAVMGISPFLPDSQAEQEPAEKKQDEEEHIPDWLSALSSDDFMGYAPKQEETPLSPPTTPPSRDENEEPDWLQRVRARHQAEEPSPEEPSVSKEPAEGLPDWLAQPKEESTPETPAFDKEIPDWLSKLETSATDRPAEPSVPAFVFDEESELPVDIPEEAPRAILEPVIPDEEAAPPYLSTLPDWISQVSAETESSEETPAEQEVPGLTPAQLPNWLEAMRPVEAVAPAAPVGEDLATQAEKIGPLAGLRGVIPAEPIIGHLRKPPAYSVKLQVSESQQRNIVLLQKLLESEGQAKPIPPRAAFTSQAVLRLVIAMFLFVAVLVPIWLNSQRLPLPDPTYVPDGIAETNALINTINSNDPVLLAMDYEPGLSAEMDAAASTIVNQIVSRGGSIALVSTNPTGPMLAERMMNKLALKRGQSDIYYANLGFVAGGAAGLLGFARSPRDILPFDLGTSTQPARADLWEVGPFGNVRSIADFALVLVITENPDNARIWIEQIQPLLQPDNVPFLMVVSAQAEPMVRPYFEGYPQQVNGLVAGLNGGATYERLTGQAGQARSYWDAFGAGLLVAEALILVGGFINMILALFMPRQDSGVEGRP